MNIFHNSGAKASFFCAFFYNTKAAVVSHGGICVFYYISE